jgi:hypothetical protein
LRGREIADSLDDSRDWHHNIKVAEGKIMASPLRLNEAVSFGKSGSVREMDPYGFDLSEMNHCWTQSETAGFLVMMGSVPPEATLHLVVNARPFIQAGHIERQQFFVFMNGLFVGFRTLVRDELSEFPVPRNYLSPRGLRIEFVIPTALSPKSLGISQDIRKLGIAISEVSFSAGK